MDAAPILVPKFLSEGDLESIAKAVSTGYQACDEFMASNVVTDNFLVGMDCRSRLITPFVEQSLTLLDGFTYEFKPNAARNCWHTRIYKNKFALTAHFMGRGASRSRPKKAVNRTVLAGRNLELFSDDSTNPDIIGDVGYAWILHSGFIRPRSVEIAIPTRDQTGIVAHTPLPLVATKPSEIEQVKEEMIINLLAANQENEEAAS